MANNKTKPKQHQAITIRSSVERRNDKDMIRGAFYRQTVYSMADYLAELKAQGQEFAPPAWLVKIIEKGE